MYRKKSSLGKKANIMYISGLALVFSLISIIFIFVALFGFGIGNDYLIWTMQNLTEEMEQDGMIKSGMSTTTQEWGDDYTSFNFHLDDLWLIAYIVFVSSSLVLAYQTRKQGYISAFSYLFYVLMFVLFLLTIFSTLTDWFNSEIIEKVFPSASITLPKFYHYTSNLGIYTSIHLGLCVIVNLFDFDFTKFIGRRKQEQEAIPDEEKL